MAENKTIHQLDPASALNGTEEFAVWQAGGTKKATANQIATFIGGGFIANDREIISGTSDTATTSDGLILWNSADAGSKQQVIPTSTGNRQVIIVQDFIGSADDNNPIIITPATGNINNSLPKQVRRTFLTTLGR